MKFITGTYQGKSFIGVLNDSEELVLDLNRAGGVDFPKTMLEGINEGEAFLEKAMSVKRKWDEGSYGDKAYSLNEIKLLAPIPRPAKNIFCIGKNYAEHAIEMGTADDIPQHPMVFTKAPTTVIGMNETVLLHSEVTDALDYEGELAVVIGKRGKSIPEEHAYEYVFGYTIINDLTARDLQERHKQFFIGKSLDSSCPMGPTIVHKSLIHDPHKLKIETFINGEVRQSSETSQMIFHIPNLISTLSKGMTLEPGDIIATGTPAGVGKGFKPPKYLKSGDHIEITIEQIGTLANVIK